jgi:hypothetical protein
VRALELLMRLLNRGHCDNCERWTPWVCVDCSIDHSPRSVFVCPRAKCQVRHEMTICTRPGLMKGTK